VQKNIRHILLTMKYENRCYKKRSADKLLTQIRYKFYEAISTMSSKYC